MWKSKRWLSIFSLLALLTAGGTFAWVHYSKNLEIRKVQSERDLRSFFLAIEFFQNNEVHSRLKLGMSPEAVWEGYSALTYAAEIGNLEAVELLVSAGANPDGKDPRGRRPIRVAALKPHREIVTYLSRLIKEER